MSIALESHAASALFRVTECSAQSYPPIKLVPSFSMHLNFRSVEVTVVEVVAVVVPDDVAVLVAVVLVVAVVVSVVGDANVAVVVPDVVSVDVIVLVGDVVKVVVGVLTTQSWKPPALYASTIAFSVAVVAPQSSGSLKKRTNPHCSFAAREPGPRNSLMISFSAEAVATHAVASTVSSTVPAIASVSQFTSAMPVAPQAASKLFRTCV